MKGSPVSAADPAALTVSSWVDDVLLAGDDREVCVEFDRPIGRGELRDLVRSRQRALADAGLAAGGTVALRLPVSLTYVATLLAAWRIGAQVSLLDHRLTEREVDRALDRVAAQFLVTATEITGGRLHGYHTVTAGITARPTGRPAETGHALIQFSSGSTGASKVIARTSADLVAELVRYEHVAGYPGRGERMVVLASMVHVLGLVGGLLNGLHAGVRLVFPERLTAAGILAAVAAGTEPTTVLGVPFHAELLTAVPDPPALPHLVRMIVAGELVRPGVPDRFTARYGVPLGTMYGMTEIGVIATDLAGEHRPAVAPTEGMALRVDAGELRIGMAASPYVGLVDPARFTDGWLRTKDAARIDENTGLVTILGRLDSQISVGGLKVDLTEVEQTIAGLPEVGEVVVVFDGQIEAYLALTGPSDSDTALAAVRTAVDRELAAFKRPRRLNLLTGLPRTATGKIVRDPSVLRAATTNQ